MRRNVIGHLLAILLLELGLQVSTPLRAQVISTEERFQDLFTTAGYGTAFGAAFGAALLSFQSKPENNLRLVAVGASVGFIAGSFLGSYIIIAPTLASDDATRNFDLQTIAKNPKNPFVVHLVPEFTISDRLDIRTITGQVTLTSF